MTVITCEDVPRTTKLHETGIPRGSEKVSGRQTMWGIFRNGGLLAIYPTQGQAEAHHNSDEKSWLRTAHMVEDTGFRFRVLEVCVAVVGKEATAAVRE